MYMYKDALPCVRLQHPYYGDLGNYVILHMHSRVDRRTHTQTSNYIGPAGWRQVNVQYEHDASKYARTVVITVPAQTRSDPRAFSPPVHPPPAPPSLASSSPSLHSEELATVERKLRVMAEIGT